MRRPALLLAAGHGSLRSQLHRLLAPDAWPRPGLSPANKVVCAAIVASAVLAILETEPAVLAVVPQAAFFAAELAFAVLFLVEYVARVYAAGEEPRYRGLAGRLRYMATPLAIIDLLAVAPFFILYGTTDTFLLRVFRLLRILRLARLGRFSLALQLLGEAVHSRRYELALSFLIAGIVLIGSAALMYTLEADTQPEALGSIPRALWWSIATLTTVGYGDVYPLTPAGKMLAGLTAISAIGLIAMPTGILAAAFSDAFQRHRGRLQADHNPPPADAAGAGGQDERG